MNKEKELAQINEEIVECKICPIGKSGLPVVGEGSADADVVFIGEAPGKQEAKTGRPFIGRSGKLLRSLITEIGLKEEDIYITSPVKYLPDRGTPTPKDIAHGRTHLMKQLAVIDPKFIVLMGSSAAQGVLGQKYPILKMHGSIIEDSGKKYYLTLHPAAAVRFQHFKVLLLEDFKKLKRLLKKV
ncbi:MAG: uracil-DNA glycosylase [Patescibacteria group bacterium]